MKAKPFPWKCPRCREQAVNPATVDYTTTIEHDGRAYEVSVPAMEVPRCQNCGKIVMVESANQRVSEAFRQTAGLLSPIQIKQGRQSLGYNQQEFADCLGVAGPTVCRWETGAQIQQRFHNDVIRAFFDVPQFRDYLARLHGIRSVGSMARPAKTA
jgi:putative zinc finger/helix-turn-helix YgiT family protein